MALGRCHTLTSVTITGENPSLAMRPREIFHPDQETLSPLLSLSNLTHLQLEPYRGFDIGDDMLRHLSLAFPHLYSLILGSLTFLWPIPSRITLIGLIPLIANCPKLHHLGIVIDATIIPDTFIFSPTQNTNIKTLQVGCSRISSLIGVTVAPFLMDLFPNVTGIVHGWYEYPDSSRNELEAWNGVGSLLKDFGPGRR